MILGKFILFIACIAQTVNTIICIAKAGPGIGIHLGATLFLLGLIGHIYYIESKP
jgi:hypothetical protein